MVFPGAMPAEGWEGKKEEKKGKKNRGRTAHISPDYFCRLASPINRKGKGRKGGGKEKGKEGAKRMQRRACLLDGSHTEISPPREMNGKKEGGEGPGTHCFLSPLNVYSPFETVVQEGEEEGKKEEEGGKAVNAHYPCMCPPINTPLARGQK